MKRKLPFQFPLDRSVALIPRCLATAFAWSLLVSSSIVASPGDSPEPDREACRTTRPTSTAPGETSENDAPRNGEADRSADETPSGETQTPVFRVEVTAPVQEGSYVDRYGSLFTVVSAEQIRDLNAWDIATAVRRVPGVTISRYNLVGSYGGADGGAVFVRGHGSGRPGSELAILVDGVPRFVGIWTHPLLDQFGIEAARRVRIYKSAQPVLLGNMSFAAVDIDPYTLPEASWHFAAESSVGEYQTTLERVSLSHSAGRYSFALRGGFRRSDGHRADAAGQSWSGDGVLAVDLHPSWRLSAYVDHAEGWAQDAGVAGGPVRGDLPVFQTDDDFSLVKLEHHAGRWTGSYRLYWDNGLIDWLQWDGESFRSVTDYDNYGLRLREAYRPWEGGEILFGLDVDSYGGRFQEVRPSRPTPIHEFRFRNVAPYVMVSHQWTGNWRVTPSFGIRYNDSRDFGGDWAPQVGITVARGRWTGYANYAHSFNLPGVWAAVNYGTWSRDGQYRDLEPELLDHFEVGIIHSLHPRVRWSLSVFSDEVDNALRFIPPPPPPPQFGNVGDYRIRGAEVTWELLPAENLSLFSGWSYLDPRPSTVPNAPRWTWTGGVSWRPWARLRLHGDAQWVDRRYVLNPRYARHQIAVDAYFLANGQVVFSPPGPFELFVAVENLSDSEYEYRPGYPMPGRTWFGGVRWQWWKELP
ncbi:MAG: TonB-dependent receptor plug domain-containing protein [Acidobacteriota bacterium]